MQVHELVCVARVTVSCTLECSGHIVTHVREKTDAVLGRVCAYTCTRMGRNGHNCSIVDFKRTKTQPWSDQIIPFSILDTFTDMNNLSLKLSLKSYYNRKIYFVKQKIHDAWVLRPLGSLIRDIELFTGQSIMSFHILIGYTRILKLL